jgi:hypothetical protein
MLESLSVLESNFPTLFISAKFYVLLNYAKRFETKNLSNFLVLKKEKKRKFNLPSCLRSNSEPTLDMINKALFLTRYELSDTNPEENSA